MKGTKKLELSEESMLEIVNDYLTRTMPMLGVAVGVAKYANSSVFSIELAERQAPPMPLPDPLQPPSSPIPPDQTLRVVRQEGVK